MLSQFKILRQAVTVLRNGGLVCFPTETVYGLGARLFSVPAVKKIYTVKGRPADNPLIVHISNQSQLNQCAKGVSPDARRLMEKFWPGPLTIIYKRKSCVPKIVCAGLDTVAIRMPSHPLARRLIEMLGEPIAAPSANRSGRPSPTRYVDVRNEMGNRVDLILKGTPSKIGLESTVVDATKKPFRILRPGFITFEDLKKVAPHILPPAKMGARKKTGSPGTRHPHYKPAFPVAMVKPRDWEKTLLRWKNSRSRIGVFSYKMPIPDYSQIVYKRNCGGDKRVYARCLYSDFFDAEQYKIKKLFVESVDIKGLGLAIMDRLSRASG